MTPRVLRSDVEAERFIRSASGRLLCKRIADQFHALVSAEVDQGTVEGQALAVHLAIQLGAAYALVQCDGISPDGYGALCRGVMVLVQREQREAPRG